MSKSDKEETKLPKDHDERPKSFLRKHWISLAAISLVVGGAMYFVLTSDNPKVQEMKTDAIVATAQVANAV